MKRRVVALAGAYGHVLQAAHPGFVDRKIGGKLVETHATEREPASKRCQRLAENGISLSTQLRQQSRKRRTARLVDASRRDQLVDELGNTLSSQARQRHRWYVER